MKTSWLLSALLLCSACGAGEGPIDANEPFDGNERDAGVVPDAQPIDSSLPDSGEPDADPVLDAGSIPDLGEPDFGSVGMDASGVDALGPDAAGADAEGPELGPDAGVVELFGEPGVASTEAIEFAVNGIAVACSAPVGGVSRPTVLISHGFFIPHTQYLGLAEHLASWGLVACSVDYAESLTGDHVGGAAQIAEVFDEIEAGGVPVLVGRVDGTKIALAGHSLGGKLSFLVAADRPTAAAVVGFDPVDASPALCSPQSCPSAIAGLPIAQDILLIGETADEVRTSIIAPACNPADENFDDFYSAAGPGTVEVSLTGASHMSFVDDRSACGTVCNACQPEAGDRAQIEEAIRWFTTAFLLEVLDGRADLGPAVRGAVAEARFVTTGRAALRSK